MAPWSFLLQKLGKRIPSMLLLVLQSEGSSPGRQGFKMAVSADGDLQGSIGGGIMEHKLVEKARAMLQNGNASGITTIWQHHDKQHPSDQSGMICSGSQQIAFIPLDDTALPILHDILQKENTRRLVVSPGGLRLETSSVEKIALLYQNENNWTYTEQIHYQPVVHIFGGGHVSLALSEVLHFLGFYIHVYDDREDLNTLEQNGFAHEKHHVFYETIGETLRSNADDFAVLMTMGYRQDKLLFLQLIRRSWRYLGMLGSKKKIETLKAELAHEGIGAAQWDGVSAPVGIPIHSKTPQEIAVSIAAEMIGRKNGAT